MVSISTLVDRVKILVLSSGTGPFELGAAIPAFRGTEALLDGATYSYALENGSNFEAGTGVYVASLSQLTRSPVISSNGGAAVNFPANVEIAFTALAQDLVAMGGTLPIVNSLGNDPAVAIAQQAATTAIQGLSTAIAALSDSIALKLDDDGLNAADDLVENIKSLLFIATGSGGIGASLNTRFRYDCSLGSFGYPVDSESDVTPALNAAMASGRDVYIPYVPGGLPMLTQPTYPTTRYSLYGDGSRSLLNKLYNGGAAFEFRGSNQTVKQLAIDFEGLSLANAGFLFDARTDLTGIELTECYDIVSYGAGGLLKDRASGSNSGVIWRAERIYGRRHRGVGASIQEQFAFLEWDDLLADFALMTTLDRAGMVVWDINGNQGGYLQKLETSNVPRAEDAGMIGMRLRNCNATRIIQGLQDGIAGDGILIDGGCANLKFINAATSICSGAAVKIRTTAGSNTNIKLFGFDGVGRKGLGAYSPANQHLLDVDGCGQLDVMGCAFQEATGSGIFALNLSELNSCGTKFRANTRYGIETTTAVSGLIDGGTTIANGLGDYLNGGAGSGSQYFHGRNIWGNGGGTYNFDGVA